MNIVELVYQLLDRNGIDAEDFMSYMRKQGVVDVDPDTPNLDNMQLVATQKYLRNALNKKLDDNDSFVLLLGVINRISNLDAWLIDVEDLVIPYLKNETA